MRTELQLVEIRNQDAPVMIGRSGTVAPQWIHAAVLGDPRNNLKLRRQIGTIRTPGLAGVTAPFALKIDFALPMSFRVPIRHLKTSAAD